MVSSAYLVFELLIFFWCNIQLTITSPLRDGWQLSIAESSSGTHLAALLGDLATPYRVPDGDTLVKSNN